MPMTNGKMMQLIADGNLQKGFHLLSTRGHYLEVHDVKIENNQAYVEVGTNNDIWLQAHYFEYVVMFLYVMVDANDDEYLVYARSSEDALHVVEEYVGEGFFATYLGQLEDDVTIYLNGLSMTVKEFRDKYDSVFWYPEIVDDISVLDERLERLEQGLDPYEE